MVYKNNKKCRLCSGVLLNVLNLGKQPLANDFSKKKENKTYPLNLTICNTCQLLQLREAFKTNFLFKNYAYYTPNRSNFLRHYQIILKKISKFKIINSDSKVLEIGCNNGDFLDFLKFEKKCLVVGVDPAQNLAEHCISKSIKIFSRSFNGKLASDIKKKYNTFDIIILRHVYAHIDNIKNINNSLKKISNANTIIYIENAYALETLKNNEFDQIYHEHMSYIHLGPMINFFKKYNLEIFDCFKSQIHGGSICLLISKIKNFRTTTELNKILTFERKHFNKKLIDTFIKNVRINKIKFTSLIKNLKKKSQIIGTYGASAKGSTLLNFYKVNEKYIYKAFDNSESKINKYLPGSKIKITSTDSIEKYKCNYIIITAWNYLKIILRKELNYLKKGGRFILPIPEPKIISIKNYKSFL
jgi:SAM-dependent methyltransferase